jgi:hypothetical protein
MGTRESLMEEMIMSKKQKEAAQETAIPFLADTPVDANKVNIQAAALVINAAKRDELAAVVCTNVDTGEEGVILCAMAVDHEGKVASYTPVGMAFTPLNEMWKDFLPPKVALGDEANEDRLRETA